MDRFIVNGGLKLYGEVKINSAKNAVLPIVAAAVVRSGKTIIENCPEITDVAVMGDIVKSIGGKAYFGNNSLSIDSASINTWMLPRRLTEKIRASFVLAGALLARFGCVSISRPGGCNIGDRPIDIHIAAFRALCVDVCDNGDVITFKKKKGEGGNVKLIYPSVGATESVMLFASSLKGETVIENAAREPEIVDLGKFLSLLGVKVKGLGSSTIIVEGKITNSCETLTYRPVADRVEAGTFLFAGAICGGELNFFNQDLKNLDEVLKILSNNACKIRPINDKIVSVEFDTRSRAYGKVVVNPYPEFPTDLQPLLVAAACFADGVTAVEERVFPKRFGYVEDLSKFGADVVVRDNLCVVSGKTDIVGTKVSAGDLRGGAALLLAALGACGRSEISNVIHIDRGYFALEEKFAALGADVRRITL